MASQFEVLAICPITGKEVTTGAIVSKPTFDDNDNPYGPFNCSACGQIHVWDKATAKIVEVHR